MTDAVSRQLLGGDVARTVVIITVVEDVVGNDVPSEFGAVLTVAETRVGGGFGEEVGLVLRRTGEVPQGGQTQVDGRLGTFKVVDVRRAFLARRARQAWDESCKLTIHIDARRSLGADARQSIDEACKPACIGVVADVGTIDGVGDGFLSVVDFLGIGTLAEVKHRTAQTEVGVELMLHAGAEESLFQGTETAVRLQRNVDGRTRIEDAFVDDTDATEGVVNGIVYILNELRSASRHSH